MKFTSTKLVSSWDASSFEDEMEKWLEYIKQNSYEFVDIKYSTCLCEASVNFSALIIYQFEEDND